MKNIISFKQYCCGKEKIVLSDMYENCDTGLCELPINVFRIEHKKFGNILFNSGCSNLISKNPITYAKYKTKHHLLFDKNDTIISQLNNEGFDAMCIKKVILTHCDPECCGCLPLIPKYELVSNAKVLAILNCGSFSDGVMKSTVPKNSIPRRAIVPFGEKTFLKDYFKWVYDVLGDGSVLGFDIDGHCETMTGYFIPEINVFIGADACINEKAVTENYIPTQKLLDLQAYPDYYLETFEKIKKIHSEHPEIKMLFSHSEIEQI